MALTPEQSIEVLRALRARLADSPLAAYAGRALEDSLRQETPTAQLDRFLDSLAESLAAASGARVDELVRRLGNRVAGENGAPISGVFVSHDAERSPVLGSDGFDIVEDPRLRRLADGIVQLRDDLRRDVFGSQGRDR